MVFQLKYRKVLRWLGEDPISWLVFYIYIYFYHIFGRYKNSHTVLAMV